METGAITKEEILGFLRENRSFFEKEFGASNFILFGSYARDEATEKSDIDLLIDMDKKSFDKRFKLKELLEKEFEKKVDLLYKDSVRTFIMRNIQDEFIYA